MKLFILAITALIALLCVTHADADREKFIQALHEAEARASNSRPRDNHNFKPMAEEVIPTTQPTTVQNLVNSMSPEEFRDSLKKSGVKSRVSKYEKKESVFEQIWNVLAESTANEPTATDGTTGTTTSAGNADGDDEHTKSLKRRAVIALAVFLPLLVVAYAAFFIAIFFFIPGSNNPGANKRGSKHSKKSSTQHSDKHRKDKDHEDSSTHGSKTSQGGSRTKNNVSTTI